MYLQLGECYLVVTLVWFSNRCNEVPAKHTLVSRAVKLERWLTMSRLHAGLQIRLSGQWAATFRWAEPQSRSLSRGDTQQLSRKATPVKYKTLTRGEQWTVRALYWHRSKSSRCSLTSGSVAWQVYDCLACHCSLCRWSFSNREHKQWLVMQTMPFGVCTKAGCQRADWDCRQLSPSLGGGDLTESCFQSCGAEPQSL